MKKVWSIALLFVLIDQATKIYVKLTFDYGQSVEVFKWFEILFIENPGMAYGVEFGGYVGKVLLTVLRIFLIGFGIMYVYYKINPKNIYLQVPIGLIMAGALGNLIDSMFYGMMFDKGLVYLQQTGEFTRSYSGLAQLNFDGYSGFLGGCVVDMLHFPIITIEHVPDWVPFWGGKKFEFFNPVFNIADSCITVGIVLLYIFRKKALPRGFNF